MSSLLQVISLYFLSLVPRFFMHKDSRKKNKKQRDFVTFATSMKKTLLVISGLICLVLGITGIFLPILPTTPFLLLSAAVFARSSDRLYNWLINHKIFGEYIRNFREDKAIPLNAKIISITTLWLFMLYSIFFIVNDKWYLQALLGSIALGVTIYILSFKTKARKKGVNN